MWTQQTELYTSDRATFNYDAKYLEHLPPTFNENEDPEKYINGRIGHGKTCFLSLAIGLGKKTVSRKLRIEHSAQRKRTNNVNGQSSMLRRDTSSTHVVGSGISCML